MWNSYGRIFAEYMFLKNLRNNLNKSNLVVDGQEFLDQLDWDAIWNALHENCDENTIRKLYGESVEENSVHGSDSLDNAKIEIDIFFKD